jgi:hypothetical protein
MAGGSSPVRNATDAPMAAAAHKRVAIVQSNYIPWKGYFDLINRVDEFILFDDMQYTRRDWRNRNLIKTPRGPVWLTIPVETKGKYLQKINETTVSDPAWNVRHWKTLVRNYSKARYFQDYRTMFENLYLDLNETFLSRINVRFIRAICDLLGIRTAITWSSEYRLPDGRTERLVELCRQAHATEYVSGPAAREYIADEQFREAGIALSYMDYAGYPEYAQLFPPFDHRVSVLDLIFNEGPAATNYMKSF